MRNETKSPLAAWWGIWACLLIGVFLINHFVGYQNGRIPAPTKSPLWMVGFVPVAVSAIIRWAVLPRMDSPMAALPVFVIGLAMAEMACFLGIFVFPAHQQELFAVSVAGLIQFIPFFAASYFSSSEDDCRD